MITSLQPSGWWESKWNSVMQSADFLPWDLLWVFRIWKDRFARIYASYVLILSQLCVKNHHTVNLLWILPQLLRFPISPTRISMVVQPLQVVPAHYWPRLSKSTVKSWVRALYNKVPKLQKVLLSWAGHSPFLYFLLLFFCCYLFFIFY